MCVQNTDCILATALGSDSITASDVRGNARELGRGEGIDTGYAGIRGEESEETGVRYERVCRRDFSAPKVSQPRGPLSAIIPPSVPIFTNLHRRRNKMKWKDFLPIPKKHRRKRSKARSEVGSNEGEVDPVALHPTGLTPDLGAGASISPAPTPLTSRRHESNGAQTNSPWFIHLTTHSRKT